VCSSKSVWVHGDRYLARDLLFLQPALCDEHLPGTRTSIHECTHEHLPGAHECEVATAERPCPHGTPCAARGPGTRVAHPGPTAWHSCGVSVHGAAPYVPQPVQNQPHACCDLAGRHACFSDSCFFSFELNSCDSARGHCTPLLSVIAAAQRVDLALHELAGAGRVWSTLRCMNCSTASCQDSPAMPAAIHDRVT